jgi:micrococcal nuclease
MKYILLVIFVICSTIYAKPRTHYGAIKIDSVISVYDGDTFRANINTLPPILGKNIAIRLANIDTPEMKDKCNSVRLKAIKARDFLREKIKNAKQIEIRKTMRGKYFRIIGTLYLDGIDIGQIMINLGLAKPYKGKRKNKWKCE